MLLASNRGLGGIFGFPDMCMIPSPAGPIPAPLPNEGMNVQAMPFSFVVRICMMAGLNMASKYLMTMLDEAGVAGPMMLPGAFTMGNPIVSIDGMPAITLTSLANGNSMNCALSAVLVPSLVNVFFCYLPSGPVAGAATAADPYARSLTADELATLHDEMELGVHGGLGAMLELVAGDDGEALRVRHVRRRSLAARMGLAPDDEVLSAQGIAVQASSLADVARALLPAEGEELSLRVRRAGALDPITLAGAQAAASASPVIGAMLPGGVAHLEIALFTPDLPRRLHNELRRLEPLGITALVLDLRGNPGGDADAFLHVAEDFLEEDAVLARVLEDDGDESALRARAGGVYTMPVVALVDRCTASAAELLAGCLQAHGRALVVGERTFGKGLAQRLVPAVGGPGTFLATAMRYRLPDGAEVEGVGIRPDVEVAASGLADDRALRAAWEAANRRRRPRVA